MRFHVMAPGLRPTKGIPLGWKDQVWVIDARDRHTNAPGRALPAVFKPLIFGALSKPTTLAYELPPRPGDVADCLIRCLLVDDPQGTRRNCEPSASAPETSGGQRRAL